MSNNTSSKIRDYAIVALCCIAAAAIVVNIFPYTEMQYLEFEQRKKMYEQQPENLFFMGPPMNVHSQCQPDNAMVNMNTHMSDSKDVTCRALDDTLFVESEISIGDVTAGSQDACIFEPIKPLDGPTKFEITYTDSKDEQKTVRTACNFYDPSLR